MAQMMHSTLKEIGKSRIFMGSGPTDNIKCASGRKWPDSRSRSHKECIYHILKKAQGARKNKISLRA